MKTKRLIQLGIGILMAALPILIHAQNVSAYNWVKTGGGVNQDWGNAVITANNKVYVTGHFSGTATFGSGTPNSINMTSNGGTDIFVARYDMNGNFEAVAKLGSTGDDDAVAIMFIKIPIKRLIIAGYMNAFASSTGNILIYPQDITIDFANGTNFIPPPLSSYPNQLGSGGMATGFAVDGNNNINVCGYFTGSAIFGPSTLNSSPGSGSGNRSTFVARIASISGNQVSYTKAINPWSDAGGTGGDNAAYGIVYSPVNTKIYITGYFKSTIRFAGASANMTASGTRDVYIAGITSTTLSWTPGEQNSGGGNTVETGGNSATQMDIGESITQDANGVYIAGRVAGNVTFNGSPSVTITGAGTKGFIVGYAYNGSLLGNPIWGGKIEDITGSSAAFPDSRSICADGNGKVYITGEAPSSARAAGTASTLINLHTSTANPWSCGYTACFSTASGTAGQVLWANKISSVYASGRVIGNSVAYFSCGLYHTGEVQTSNHQFGNMPVSSVFPNSDDVYTARMEPDLSITQNKGVCTLLSPATITLNAASSPGATYTWSGPGLNSTTGSSVTASVSNTGTYTYTVTVNSPTCSGMTGTVSIGYSLPANMVATGVQDYSNFCFNDGPTSFQLNAGGASTLLNYSWSPLNYLSCSNCASPTMTPPIGNYNLTVTVTDACGSTASDPVSVTLNNSVCRIGSATESGTTYSFSLFPNPGNGLFTLTTGNEELKTIVISDISGRVVSKIETREKSSLIDLQNEPAGIYFVQLVSENDSEVRQLVKE